MKKLLALTGLILALAACSPAPRVDDSPSVPARQESSSAPADAVTLTGPGGKRVQVQVDIARTVQEQEKGLMERTELPEGQGMLFIFQQEQPLGFWMKNTLIPLDVLFFDAEGEFVSASSMTPCTVEPCPIYYSSAPALYALEVPIGFAEKQGGMSGWRLETE